MSIQLSNLNQKPSQTSTKVIILGLDGIRAIAVFLVIITHNFYFKFNLTIGGDGVRLFFVLSGFLIINILTQRRALVEFGTATTKIELIHFFENRVFRIWPVYFAALILAFWVRVVRDNGEVDALSWVGNVFFFGNVLVAHFWFDWRQVGHFWSVGVEEQFYLWAGFAFLLTARRWHEAICWAVLSLSVVVAAATIAIIPDLERAHLSIDVGSLTNFGLIAIGGLAAMHAPKLKPLAWAAAPSLAIYIILAIIDLNSSTLGAFSRFFPAIFIVLTIAGIYNVQSSMLVRFLELWPISYLGKISYGVYLFHTLIHFETILGPSWFDDHATYKALAETFLSIGLASLSFHYFERPILKFRDRRRERQATTRQALTPAT